MLCICGWKKVLRTHWYFGFCWPVLAQQQAFSLQIPLLFKGQQAGCRWEARREHGQDIWHNLTKTIIHTIWLVLSNKSWGQGSGYQYVCGYGVLPKHHYMYWGFAFHAGCLWATYLQAPNQTSSRCLACTTLRPDLQYFRGECTFSLSLSRFSYFYFYDSDTNHTEIHNNLLKMKVLSYCDEATAFPERAAGILNLLISWW